MMVAAGKTVFWQQEAVRSQTVIITIFFLKSNHFNLFVYSLVCVESIYTVLWDFHLFFARLCLESRTSRVGSACSYVEVLLHHLDPALFWTFL